MKIRGNTITVQQISLPLNGGTMRGVLDMANHIIKGIPAPTADDHAASKKYADNLAADSVMKSKKYADTLTFTKEVVTEANKWQGDKAPYRQTIAVDGILATDRPHYGPVYSEDAETAVAEKDAFACVDDLDTADGSVTFTCFDDKPEANLTIQMEVNR